MEITKSLQKMSFKDYYHGLKKQHVELRNEICEKLGISPETFYVKFRENGFNYPQKLVISQIVNQPIEVLFPN